ncbi:hypothetical protein BLI708_06375 [Bifidobacterium imperatoris]|uniref:Uncharacterized protein n=1 Tax=Bifidobacterium imperatoris TaxID=2020965 RepID=A0A2N5IQN8_9BIFI|nr:hypothetical protein [Bifidobacterium imperatoris]PLS24256.1 hypothetical protein Tam1G_1665 [Bifidobacterium imperatoris]QSY56903.1 hypothetical protein BLI708_06375 [Bifidobacterium imperatoris]
MTAHDVLEWLTTTRVPVWVAVLALVIGLFARELAEAWNRDRERERAYKAYWDERGGENNDEDYRR